MPITVFKPSTSETRTLMVTGYPFADILQPSSYPSEKRAGESFNVTGRIRNAGYRGAFVVRLIDRDTGETVDSQSFPDVESGATVDFSLYAVMPSKDWNLRIESGHYEYDPYTGYEVWKTDDTEDFTVTLLVEVDTTLTLNPIISVRPGENYSYTGKLVRADTGAGLAGEYIHCERQEAGVWREVEGSPVRTASDGTFVLSTPAPTTPGSYLCRARYYGTPGYFTLRVGLSSPNVIGAMPVIAGVSLIALSAFM